MTRQEFKQKYFSNNFYWVNRKNYSKLQDIGIEFGCVNPNGRESRIEWHDGFKCLGFRTYDDNPTKFQKEPFLLSTEKATYYEEMVEDYTHLTIKP